jgi:hypothetical protein
LTMTECLSIAFFGNHIPIHWSCIYLTCIHLANSYQPVWISDLFLSFLLLHFFWKKNMNNWMRYWRIPTKFQPHKIQGPWLQKFFNHFAATI